MKLHFGNKNETSGNTCYIDLETLFPRFKKLPQLEQIMIEIAVTYLLKNFANTYKTNKVGKAREFYAALCRSKKKEKLVFLQTVKHK